MTDTAAMLARAMGIAQNRNTSLSNASGLIVRRYVFERVSFRTSPKSAAINSSTNCIFVVVLIDELVRCRT